VEAILLIPFLLLLIMLIISSSRYASHLIYNSIDTRTTAWRAALFDHCPSGVQARFGGQYLGAECEQSSEYARGYLSTFAVSPEAALFTSLLAGAGLPEATTVTARSEFRALLIKDSYRSLIQNQYSLDITPAWEREQMPNGYQSVLPSVE